MDDSRTDLPAILQRVAAKEAAALTELHLMVGSELFGIVLSIIKNRQESEDALQNTFLKIWKKASSYQAALGSPMSWLVTMARNTAFDHYRKQSRQAEQKLSVQPDLTAMTTSDAPSSADRVLLDAERRQEIRNAMSALAEDQREAIELAFFSGHTQQEVSALLEVPLGTIKARIRRGMQALKPRLASQS